MELSSGILHSWNPGYCLTGNEGKCTQSAVLSRSGCQIQPCEWLGGGEGGRGGGRDKAREEGEGEGRRERGSGQGERGESKEERRQKPAAANLTHSSTQLARDSFEKEPEKAAPNTSPGKKNHQGLSTRV